MTLNQVIQRIKATAESHRQVNTFFEGLVHDFASTDIVYPLILAEKAEGGTVSRTSKLTTIPFSFYFLDVVNISEQARENRLDVQSDMLSIAEDFMALLHNPDYSDWLINNDASFTFYDEAFEDYLSGVKLDLSISTIYLADRCQVPIISIGDYPGILTEEGLRILSETGQIIIRE